EIVNPLVINRLDGSFQVMTYSGARLLLPTISYLISTEPQEGLLLCLCTRLQRTTGHGTITGYLLV
ncbi:MAG: hypothetical protein AAGA85_09335, partial [Bacteroidota bacterium]